MIYAHHVSRRTLSSTPSPDPVRPRRRSWALNKEDGGNRKFFLVECEDYADTITAERVRRVINGVPTVKDENLKTAWAAASPIGRWVTKSALKRCSAQRTCQTTKPWRVTSSTQPPAKAQRPSTRQRLGTAFSMRRTIGLSDLRDGSRFPAQRRFRPDRRLR